MLYTCLVLLHVRCFYCALPQGKTYINVLWTNRSTVINNIIIIARRKRRHIRGEPGRSDRRLDVGQQVQLLRARAQLLRPSQSHGQRPSGHPQSLPRIRYRLPAALPGHVQLASRKCMQGI